MDKTYQHQKIEDGIYKKWEKGGYFSPKIDSGKKPFTIILPPPNANAPLHFGHAMYVIEDILVRFHRMKGDPTLWLPGADHAGFETQFVFEKQLEKKGKSRLDFDRETLYKMIWDYVWENKVRMESQLRKLGFSLDWSREKFTLDKNIVEIVYGTFKKMYDNGLIYRGNRLVNYCTRCGTSFSDLEVNHKEQIDPLYYIKYGPLVLATVRPETKFGDTAVAVNPGDTRYQKYIGGEIEFQTLLGKAKMKVIADELIDPNFGTGVAKVTPAHDMKDFEIGQRHNLPVIQVIDFKGRLNEKAGKYKGLRVGEARKIIAEDMKKAGLIEKVDASYIHTIETCYKCGTTIEPMLLPQWFIKMETLAKPAIEAVKKGKIKFFPKRFGSQYLFFLENIRDWNISRQIVWGIRIPVWFCGGPKKANVYRMGFAESVVPQVFAGKTKTYRLSNYGLKNGQEINFENSQTKKLFGQGAITGIQYTTVGKISLRDKDHGATYKTVKELILAFKRHNPVKEININSPVVVYSYKFDPITKKIKDCGEIIISAEKLKECPTCGSKNLIQDEDTFDTWFSSAQWPFATLMTAKSGDFEYFYPMTVMETGYDILPWWVARMVMMGIYVTEKIPFKHVVLHGVVKDPLGKKMSKSKGNVVDPLEIIKIYGADAVRFALVYGTAFGNDQALSYPKLEAMRKFINKLWNIGRFVVMQFESEAFAKKEVAFYAQGTIKRLKKEDKEILNGLEKLINQTTESIEQYRFHDASDMLYDFTWHTLADKYLEAIKDRLKNGEVEALSVLRHVFLNVLKLLHPFMPYVTEELWGKVLRTTDKLLIISNWPQNEKDQL